MGNRPWGYHPTKRKPGSTKARRTRPARYGRFKSKLEKDFWIQLGLEKKAGQWLDIRYECMRFKIGESVKTDKKTGKVSRTSSWYTPDFMAVDTDGYIIFFETKGRMMEAARVRFLAVCELYPYYRWIMVVRKGSRFFVHMDSEASPENVAVIPTQLFS